MELFRFLTAGSVDDGKSTLIGHLMHLIRAFKEDEVEAVQIAGNQTEKLNYAFFTDGLKTEREKGITIDVSYKYFTTDKRRFIIADCPGHKEFTRNMFTGASTADLLVLMINVENGITEQTLRHFKIGQLLDIPNVVICINKMDLVDYAEKPFSALKNQFLDLLVSNRGQCVFIPVSATEGDNLKEQSVNMPWYQGPALLDVLNQAPKRKIENNQACFPVQHVVKHDREYYLMGTAFEGHFEVGEEVVLLPARKFVRIASIMQFDKKLNKLNSGEYGALTLSTNFDLNRGAVLLKAKDKEVMSTEFEAHLCWMDERALSKSVSYLLKLATQEVPCRFKKVWNNSGTNDRVSLNSLFHARLETETPVVVKTFIKNNTLGAFILIDLVTNKTVAGGVVKN